jgi:hypothetical protein
LGRQLWWSQLNICLHLLPWLQSNILELKKTEGCCNIIHRGGI